MAAGRTADRKALTDAVDGNGTNSTANETATRSVDAPTAEPLSVDDYVRGTRTDDRTL